MCLLTKVMRRKRENLNFYLWSDVIEGFHSMRITYDYIKSPHFSLFFEVSKQNNIFLFSVYVSIFVVVSLYNTIVWSGYWYQTICLICLHGTKCSTITWPWVFREESCIWLCHGVFGLNPASGYAVGFQGRILFMAVPWILRHQM